MKRRARDDGATAVEFALISIPLIILVLAILQFGFIFYSQIMLTQSAREGARALALNLGTSTPGICDADCVATAKQKSIDSFSSPTATFHIDDSNFERIETCDEFIAQQEEAIVQIRYRVDAAFLFTIDIVGKSSMPCGG